MTTRLGIDISDARTSWASTDRESRGSTASGSFPSVVGALADGSLVVGDAVASTPPGVLVQSSQGFLSRLGQSEPLMLAGTPYGAEALVARLIATAIEQAQAAHGNTPVAVALVHDDGLDQFRVGLLSEAARLAGVPVADLLVVPRGELGAGDPAQAAASFAWQQRPDVGGPGGAAVAAGAAAGAAAVAGAAAAAVGALADGSSVAAAAPGVAGPAGAPLAPTVGPAGTPLAPTAGPAGAPLAPAAGPAGTPLAPTAGPTGAPLSPVGPAGTPLAPTVGPVGTPLAPTAGPAGVPLSGAPGPAGTPLTPLTSSTPPTVTVPGAVKRPRVPTWTAVAGGVAAVAVVVGVVVVATSGSDPATTKPVAATTTIAGSGSGSSVAGGGDTTVAPGGSGDVIDVSPLIGTWRADCAPYIDGSGASSQDYVVTVPEAGRVDFTINGHENTSTDCSDEGDIGITVVYSLKAVNVGEVDGVTAFAFELLGDPTCTSPEPLACTIALSGAALPDGRMALGVDASGDIRIAEPGAPLGADGLPAAWMQQDVEKRG